MSHPDRIDPEVAYDNYIEGRAIFIDARPASSYESARFQLPEAVHIATGSGAEIVMGLRDLPFGTNMGLVVYCDEPHEAASYQVASYARQVGFDDVAVLTGGYSAWAESELPVEMTPHAIPLQMPPPAPPAPTPIPF